MSSRMSFLKSWLSFWAYKILKGIGDKMKYKGALITGRSKQAQPKYNLLPESRTQSERTAKIDQSNSSGCLSQKNRSEAQRHPWGRCWAEYRRTQKVPVNFSFVCYVNLSLSLGLFWGLPGLHLALASHSGGLWIWPVSSTAEQQKQYGCVTT